MVSIGVFNIFFEVFVIQFTWNFRTRFVRLKVQAEVLVEMRGAEIG